MSRGLTAFLSEALLMGLALAGGYAIGEQILEPIGGEIAGIVIASVTAGWAITATRGEANRAGYKQGYREGRDGTYDRSQDQS